MTKRGRKIGRPRKKPGEPVHHRLTPRMRVAITAIVEDNCNFDEAAELAGITRSAIYKALKDNPQVRDFYKTELRFLLSAAKARAAHALIKELKGDNAAARVAAARTLLAETDTVPTPPGLPQAPGFSILVVDARTAPQALSVPTIEHEPA